MATAPGRHVPTRDPGGDVLTLNVTDPGLKRQDRAVSFASAEQAQAPEEEEEKAAPPAAAAGVGDGAGPEGARERRFFKLYY